MQGLKGHISLESITEEEKSVISKEGKEKYLVDG